MGLRRWLRRIEHDARASADTCCLVDEETGEEFKVPQDAFLRVMSSFGDDEPDPEIEPLLDRLQRLCYTNGDPFWWQLEECYMQDDYEK
jgi:hypothetical protein